MQPFTILIRLHVCLASTRARMSQSRACIINTTIPRYVFSTICWGIKQIRKHGSLSCNATYNFTLKNISV